MAIPAYNNYRNKAAENAAKSEASEIMKAVQASLFPLACFCVIAEPTCIDLSVLPAKAGIQISFLEEGGTSLLKFQIGQLGF